MRTGIPGVHEAFGYGSWAAHRGRDPGGPPRRRARGRGDLVCADARPALPGGPPLDALRRRRRSEYPLLSGTDVAVDLDDAPDIVGAAHASITQSG